MTSIQPLGAGQGEALTEVIQVLAVPDHTQEVLRAIVRHLVTLDAANWVHVSVGPDQGWIVPQWLDPQAEVVVVHHKTRPCVIIDDLPDDPQLLLGGLKRNLKESLRRARNRSVKLGGIEFLCVKDVGDVEAAVRRLIGLHRMRSRMAGKVTHPDVLGGTPGEFLCAAAVQLAEEGLARVHVATHLGKPVAAQLVLSDGHADYISVSGMDPEYWDLNLNTMLIYEAIVEAVRQGRRTVNLSTGPSIAKMRWSSKVVAYNDFAIVHGDHRSRFMHGLYAHATLGFETRRERRRHRTLAGERTGAPGVRVGASHIGKASGAAAPS